MLVRMRFEGSALERIWHMQDSHGQILTLAFRQKSFKTIRCFLIVFRDRRELARRGNDAPPGVRGERPRYLRLHEGGRGDGRELVDEGVELHEIGVRNPLGQIRDQPRHLGGGGDYLTQSINQMVLESQLTHKEVNILFELVIVNNKLTVWEGGG